MTWPEELDVFLPYARGDLAVFIGLAALRKVENGGPGRELGVLSVPAPTLDDQVRIAAASFRNNETRANGTVPRVRDRTTGLYTAEFLDFFSARWAPLNAPNDPRALNRHHAGNLRKFYRQFAEPILTALRGIA